MKGKFDTIPRIKHEEKCGATRFKVSRDGGKVERAKVFPNKLKG